jgi:hypothetical protein
MPDWKLTIHALFLSSSPHAGRWLKQNSKRTDVAPDYASMPVGCKPDFYPCLRSPAAPTTPEKQQARQGTHTLASMICIAWGTNQPRPAI